MQLLSLLTASCPPPPSATRKNPACQRPERNASSASNEHGTWTGILECRTASPVTTAWVRHRRPLPSLLGSPLRRSAAHHVHDMSNLARTARYRARAHFRSRQPSLHFQRTGPRFGPSQVNGEKVRCETLVPGGQTDGSLTRYRGQIST